MGAGDKVGVVEEAGAELVDRRQRGRVGGEGRLADPSVSGTWSS